MSRKLLNCGVILYYSLFCIIVSTAGQQKDKLMLTMDDAIAIAMQNNRDVLIAREEQKKGDQQVREARSSALPKINLNNIYTRTIFKPAFFLTMDDEIKKIEIGTDNAVQSNLGISQLLYSGGQIGTAIEIAKIFSDSFTELIDQTEKNVKLQVKQQFLGILLSIEVLKVNKRNLEQAEAHFDHVTTLYSRGAASEFDVLRAEVQVANVRPGVISAENDLTLQKNVLKNILGLPMEQELDIDGELKPQLIEESLMKEAGTNAYLNRSDYRNLELTRSAMEKRIKIERAKWLPTISAVYNLQFQGMSNTFTFGPDNRVISQNAGLNLSFPIFDGFQTSARVQQVEIDVKKTDYQLLKLKEAIDIQITQALNKMDNARKRIDALSKTVEQAQKAYTIAEVRYNSGQGTQLELFDAQVALEVSELNTVQSIYDYELAKAQWEHAVGW